MKRGSFAASFLTCLLLAGVTTTAYAAGIVAERSHHRIVVDGKEAQMEAYVINGSNYVRLRDIGKAVGFEVYWDGDAKCVQVESGKPYTGIAPVKAETSGPASQPEVTTPADDVDAMKQDIRVTSPAAFLWLRRRMCGITRPSRVRAMVTSMAVVTPTPIPMKCTWAISNG